MDVGRKPVIMRDMDDPVAEYHAIAFCDIQEGEFIGTLRRDEETR